MQSEHYVSYAILSKIALHTKNNHKIAHDSLNVFLMAVSFHLSFSFPCFNDMSLFSLPQRKLILTRGRAYICNGC